MQSVTKTNSDSTIKARIGFIGGGNMARAILTSLSEQQDLFKLFVCDRNADKRQFFQDTLGVSASADYRDFMESLDIVVLAVKPQGFPSLLDELKSLIKPHQLIISVAAGVSVEAILRGIGQKSHPIIRVMPNTPSTIGLGASAIYANGEVSESQQAITQTIFSSCGVTAWLQEEQLISAAVAVSGSSPAYIYYLMEIMTKVGIEMGLDETSSKTLTQQAVLGSAKYSQLSDLSLETLKKNVMSPKGTTEQAIFSLENNHFDRIIKEAMSAAFDRDQELSKIISKEIK
ncbi:pyrroline-5-carboxylate reductase [Ignatzschineria rhizosphaerae]|uniref:Pyrroline-5-carboxylate reductase n=1 Tax=Ignatzschineria rhizosphaerae TaxID=2923279 RepID=A0ABY3WX82_9GAMM|nr:pyrroline-5-carboxylate reductase [Ignatzschineria rhizosphaerae]UNM95217.1 pyrroline-5-carboxylate reductase [Ignatzschineria rhizosphaerae]